MLLRFKWLVCSIAAVLALFALLYVLFGRTPDVQHITAAVRRMDLESVVLATGPIEATHLLNIGAQVNGQVKAIHVRLGERVKKGQLLAEIDPQLQENALSKARANRGLLLAQQKAKTTLLKRAEQVFARQQALYAANASAQSDVEQAEVDLEAARAEVSALESQILLAQLEMDSAVTNLGYTQIKAPADGEIMAIVTKEGQTIVSAQASPTILIMGNMDRMTVKARVSEADIVRVSVGQAVEFSVTGAPDRVFKSTIGAVELLPESAVTESNVPPGSSVASTAPVYYNAIFEIDNPERVLKPLMTANIKIIQARALQTLVIPIAALGQKQSESHQFEVRRLSATGEVVPTVVTLGLRSTTQAQVLSGLELDDRVILE
ncbi:efflux RND transporter periplasmic adaptor subunit [Pseudomonas fluorescens]|uniref:efflux RND transporter periplasmic adaptor subunit n=1 Tax=Pseudomonas fluorescens TaxID=294 RepID=UPI001486055A|nr:efflux RND transporter periplasmic adaptor subunit [Pseudomonas fluorescens]